MRTTLRDIARESGLDISTVSRSLSGAYGINKDTRARVEQAALRLHYVPNGLARGLATGISKTIALIVNDIRNPFYAEIARGVEDTAFAAGFDLMLGNSDLKWERQMRYVHAMASKQIDGIILNPAGAIGVKEREDLLRYRLPVVVLSSPERKGIFHSVLVDNRAGGRLAGEHLKALGHRRAVVLAAASKQKNLMDRVKGFSEAFGAEVQVYRGEHSHRGACDLMTGVLSERRDFSAVFAVNDAMAIGALEAMKAAGISVPDEISLVGFDDVAVAALLDPPLTTVAQPKYDIGVAAAEMLMRKIPGSGVAYDAAIEQRQLNVELKVRRSTKEFSDPQSR